MRRPRVVIIAHRGASGIAPESTRAAIREAVRARVQAIELDVQTTQDGRLVVFHDERLERTTDGHGWLCRTPYARLARLDAGGWFHPRFAGERILLVSEAVRAIPSWMRINFELKPTGRPRALARRFLRAVRQWRIEPRVLISSFDPAILALCQGSLAARGLICRSQPDRALRRAVRLGCQTWNPLRTLVTPRRIAQAHQAGLRVLVWTVDEPAQARRLIRLGIDGFFTNHPERFARFHPAMAA